MRVVIDTNVLLSGLLWRGAPHALLQAARIGTVELVLSEALLDEFARVIRYRKFAAIIDRINRSPERIIIEVRALADVVTAPPLGQPVCRDADDDAVLACAIAAHADLIVSGDDDLLTLKAFQGIPITTAADALLRINSKA